MAKPHKHAEVIKAWADGAEIERSTGNGVWWPCPYPNWKEKFEYRVKPPREFPKSSLTGEQAWRMYTDFAREVTPGAYATHECMKFIVDSAVKQYILDSESVDSSKGS